MASIVHVNNPFDPFKETHIADFPGGATVADCAKRLHPERNDFLLPTYCVFNGKPLMRDKWRTTVVPNDGIVNFVTVQGGIDPVTLAYIAIAIAVIGGVAVALSMPKPTKPGELPEPDTVYDLRGQRNQIRLGAPIEVPYGYCRLWPSLASRPYNRYIDNEQYQFSLYCLGQGYFDIADVSKLQFEDTPIANFQGVFYEVSDPGEPVTFFPDNVITSDEVGNVELFGPNETEYAGLTGPFILNPAGTQANLLEVDVALPLGLFVAGANNRLNAIGMTARFEYQKIDDAGAPIGSWTEFPSFHKVLATNTPQRYTIAADVDPGRYQVRGQRLSLKETSVNAGNVLRWETAKAYLTSTKDYGNVTMVALKVKASNNLNDRVAQRFNVWATRKLPIYNLETETWSAPQTTRGIVPALCDLFRASYGGQQNASKLELTELWTHHATFEENQQYFDYVFDQRSTVWEAAKIIARTGRAVPMLNIQKATIIRDIEQTVAKSIYNKDNIVKDSFNYDVQFAEVDDFDGVEIEYTDPVTFLPATVKCLVGDEIGDKCEKVKFPGITNRQRAYDEGIYYRKLKLTQRANVTFKTGREGRIPRYGDLIKVAHDAPKWSQGGLVVSIVGTTVTLNEPVSFGVGVHKIAFRTKINGVLGPYTVTAGDAANKVELDDAIDTSSLNFADNSEPPLYYFGPEGFKDDFCKIVDLQQDETTVEIKAVPVNSVVYKTCEDEVDARFEFACIPPDPDPVPFPDPVPPNPQIPCVSVVTSVNPLDPNSVKVSWDAAVGATQYVIETSADGVTWKDGGSTFGLSFNVPRLPGETLYVRVKGVNNNKGGGSGGYCQPWIPGPGSGDDDPDPFCDDNYWCLLDPVVPALVSVFCKSRGGNAVMIGFNEFTDYSSPRKKYRRLENTGSASSDYFHNPNCLYLEVGGKVEDIVCTLGTTCQYDRVTAVLNVSGENRCVNSSGPDTVFAPSCMAPFTPVCGRGVTTTRLESSTYLIDECCPWGPTPGVYSNKGTSDAYHAILSDEDTEDDAKERLIATLSNFAEIEWSPCLAFPCCNSFWYERHPTEPDFDFAYQEAQCKVHVEGFNASGFSVLRAYIYATDLETGVETLNRIETFATYADMLGGADFEFDLPNEKGFSFTVKKLTYHSL